MVNPKKIMQLKDMGERFMANHPKVAPFFQAAMGSIEEGSIIEIRVTSPQGHELCSNIRVSEEDMEMLREVRELTSSAK